MYRTLKDTELEDFVDKYFQVWKQDIFKVSCIEYDNKKEYLINEHYIYTI